MFKITVNVPFGTDREAFIELRSKIEELAYEFFTDQKIGGVSSIFDPTQEVAETGAPSIVHKRMCSKDTVHVPHVWVREKSRCEAPEKFICEGQTPELFLLCDAPNIHATHTTNSDGMRTTCPGRDRRARRFQR